MNEIACQSRPVASLPAPCPERGRRRALQRGERELLQKPMCGLRGALMILERRRWWRRSRLRLFDRGRAERDHTSSPLWQGEVALLRSVPGVGPMLAATIVAQLPERGVITHKEIASLVGVAPI